MRNRKAKRLKDQVIVITGASSGTGLATARMAARRKAALSDVARVFPYVAAGVALAAGVRRWRAS